MNPADFVSGLLSGVGLLYNSVKNGQLERETADAIVSAAFSALINLLWNQKKSKLVLWAGEDEAMQAAATSMFKVLQTMETKSFLRLAVDNDLLLPANLDKYKLVEYQAPTKTPKPPSSPSPAHVFQAVTGTSPREYVKAREK